MNEEHVDLGDSTTAGDDKDLLEDGQASPADDEPAAQDEKAPAVSDDNQAAPPSDKTGDIHGGPGYGIDEGFANLERVIGSGVSKIIEVFEAKLAYDASKQVQIDRLHQELLQYRDDVVTRAARPLVNGMIRLHDDMGKLLSTLQLQTTDELSPDRFFSILEGLQEDVEIVLSQNGITSYKQPFGPFDPRRQRLLRKITTSDAALAGRVADTIRPGFEQGTEIVEKERVAIYEYVPAAAPIADTSSENGTDSESSDSVTQDEEEV